MLKNIENQSSALTAGNKRNAEAMLQQYVGSPLISPSTETVVSDTQSDTENYTLKRPRVNGEEPHNGPSMEKISPSRVIHVRNLPQDTSESEIMLLACKHGQVTNLILMRSKRQAFVEMHDVNQAVGFVRYHQNQVPATIRGQGVQLQYSATYSELKPGQRSHASGMKPTAVLHVNVDNLLVPITLPILHQIFSKHGIVQKIITFNKNNQFQSLIQMADVREAEEAKMAMDGQPVFPNCCVLRIDFSKMISINVKYNNDKSRDFTNPDLPSGDDNGPQATAGSGTNLPGIGAAPPSTLGSVLNPVRPLGMVPYHSAASMTPNPMMSLAASMSGYRVLPGFNPTTLQSYTFHPQTQLNPQQIAAVTLNQQRAAQLTAPHLPGQPQQLSPTQLQHLQFQQLLMSQQLQGNQLQGMATNQLQAMATNQLQAQSVGANQLQGMAVNQLQHSANQAKLHPFVATAGQLHAQQLLANHPTLTSEGQTATTQYQGHSLTASNQLHEQQQLLMQAQSRLQATPHFLSQNGAAMHRLPIPVVLPLSGPPLATSPEMINSASPNPHNSNTPVVLVSNLNSKKVSPDALFTLFGMYGDVIRVKILYHKLDTAMVQFADPTMALMACKFLDRAVFWESEVRVMPSKHHNIQMPSNESHKAGSMLTRDYTTSDLHRYSKLGSRNMSNIYPPSNTLHLANIPAEMSDENSIMQLFSKYGNIEAFRFFSKDKRMALIQMHSVPAAIEALIGMHNYAISSSHNLRVSFSKSGI